MTTTAVRPAAPAAAIRSRARPRILVLGQTLPYPPDGGAHLRMYHVMRLLAEEFDVKLLAFYRRAERRTAAEVTGGIVGLAPVARTEAFPIPQERSRVRWLFDHLRSVLFRRAYTWYAYRSAAFRERLRTALTREACDLVQLDSLDLAAYLPDLDLRRVVCVHQNVESALLRRRAAAERRPWAAWYLLRQAAWTEREERRWLPAVALNVAVSAEDAAALRALAPGARVIVVPNGVDARQIAAGPAAGEGIVCVGGTNWFPNADALAFLAGDILPALRRLRPGVTATWVGRASEGQRRECRERYGIDLTGYVPEVAPYVRSAGCVVVPLRVGGGTRLKILEAWAMGKAVVSTAVGCEGLGAVDGENILIRDDPEAFARAVADVLAEGALQARLGQAGRALVERRFNWAVIGRAMHREYRALLAAATG